MKSRHNGSIKLDVKLRVHTDEYERFWTVVERISPKSVSLTCPHCNTFSSLGIDAHVDRSGNALNIVGTCPSCEKTIFIHANYSHKSNVSHLDAVNPDIQIEDTADDFSIYPSQTIVTLAEEIPEIYREDFQQAKLIVALSPKASAALSRRILQNILREHYGIKENNLYGEIGKFLEREDLPSHISQVVDAIRNIGNFAAHPTKNKHTGEIVEVDPGEAEWMLEVLEALFDFTFVQPVRLEKKKKKLNKKLNDIGKPPLQ
jgi:hypothetical protein